MGRFAVGTVVILALLVVNGGYVYKTTCPNASGGSTTGWTYGINDVLPYIRTTSAPCSSHTATRLLVSAVGIAPLGHHASFSAADMRKNQTLATTLGSVNAAINREYATERAMTGTVRKLVKTNRQAGITFVETVMTLGSARFEDLSKRVDRAPDAPDANLTRASDLLGQWLRLQAEVDRVGSAGLSSGGGVATYKAQTLAVARKIAPVATELQALAPTLAAAYPQLTRWSYLNSSSG